MKEESGPQIRVTMPLTLTCDILTQLEVNKSLSFYNYDLLVFYFLSEGEVLFGIVFIYNYQDSKVRSFKAALWLTHS